MTSQQTIVIIGAGPGIGYHTALRFAQNGYRVALMARDEQRLQSLVTRLTDQGYDATAHVADVRTTVSLAAQFEVIKRIHGSIDVLLYNALANTPGRPTVLRAENLRADFEVNVIGALNSVNSALPYLSPDASILLTGGGLALSPVADVASLSLGKAALRNLAYSLHDELKEQSIHVGTLTIAGFVKEGTYFAPQHIAQALHELRQERAIERIYKEEQQ